MFFNVLIFFILDENRDINASNDEDVKRERLQYGADQIYTNVSIIT